MANTDADLADLIHASLNGKLVLEAPATPNSSNQYWRIDVSDQAEQVTLPVDMIGQLTGTFSGVREAARMKISKDTQGVKKTDKNGVDYWRFSLFVSQPPKRYNAGSVVQLFPFLRPIKGITAQTWDLYQPGGKVLQAPHSFAFSDHFEAVGVSLRTDHMSISIPPATPLAGQTLLKGLWSYPDKLTFAYQPTTSGGARLTIDVALKNSAGVGNRVKVSFNATVKDTNRGPEESVNLPDVNLVPGGTAKSVELSHFITDPDGHPITFTFNSLGQADQATVTLSTGDDTRDSKLTITPGSGLAIGDAFVVTITATDTANLANTFSLQILGVKNNPPVVVNPLPVLRASQLLFATVDLGPVFHDPDGDVLAYYMKWSRASDGTVFPAFLVGSQLTRTHYLDSPIDWTLKGPGANAPVGSTRVWFESLATPGLQYPALETYPPVWHDDGLTFLYGGDRYTVKSGTWIEFNLPGGSRADALRLDATIDPPLKTAVGVVGVSAGQVVFDTWVQDLPTKFRMLYFNAGTTVTQIIADDRQGGTASDSVTFVAYNTPTKVGTIPDQSVRANEAVQIQLRQYFADVDGIDTLTFRATTTDGKTGLRLAIAPPETLSIGGVVEGTYSVTATAVDPQGDTVDQTFSVQVTEGILVEVEPIVSPAFFDNVLDRLFKSEGLEGSYQTIEIIPGSAPTWPTIAPQVRQSIRTGATTLQMRLTDTRRVGDSSIIDEITALLRGLVGAQFTTNRTGATTFTVQSVTNIPTRRTSRVYWYFDMVITPATTSFLSTFGTLFTFGSPPTRQVNTHVLWVVFEGIDFPELVATTTRAANILERPAKVYSPDLVREGITLPRAVGDSPARIVVEGTDFVISEIQARYYGKDVPETGSEFPLVPRWWDCILMAYVDFARDLTAHGVTATRGPDGQPVDETGQQS